MKNILYGNIFDNEKIDIQKTKNKSKDYNLER